MWDSQNGECAICGNALTAGCHTDHDHATGRVRALTCPTCNRGLGFFRENAAVLRSAAAYIEYHAARAAAYHRTNNGT